MKKKEKKGKLGKRKSVRMVELNQWVLMGRGIDQKGRKRVGGLNQEECSEGLTDKHDRKKHKILKQINGMNKRK